MILPSASTTMSSHPHPHLPKSRPMSKKPHTIPLVEDHCLISCIYNVEIFSGGGIPTSRQSTVVNLASQSPIIGMNPSSLSPPAIQKALAPAKAAALLASGSLECATCGSSADNICSSIEAYRGSNSADTLTVGKFHVLHFSERLICCCNDEKCISEARRRRNGVAGRGGHQVFKLAFRCAIQPTSSVLSVVTKAGKVSASSKCTIDKENAHNNIVENENGMNIGMAS